MTTHLPTQQIKDYVGRSLSGAEMTRVNEHLFGCGACYQQFLAVFQTRRRFPIEIDLDELSGLKDWHIQGEELKQYVEGRMDELDLGYANLHLRECAWCREEVSHFSEFTSRLEFYLSKRHAPLKQMRARSKYFRRPGAMPLAWSPVRLAGAALVLLLISATLMWSIFGTKPRGGDATLSAQSQEDRSSSARVPSAAQSADTSRPVQAPLPDTSASAGHTFDSKNNSRGSNSQVPAIHISPNRRKAEKAKLEIEASLIAENLTMPSVIEAFDRTPVALRGDDNRAESFKVASPYSTVISDDQPVFRWTALSGASSYVVSVYDADLNLIETSEPLAETEWLASSRLKQGTTYTWMVTALRDGKEILAPTLPSRAEFKIIERSALIKLNRRIKQIHSRAARGALYAKAGLLDEAEREFLKHLTLYPVDEHARKLLQTIRSWHQP